MNDRDRARAVGPCADLDPATGPAPIATEEDIKALVRRFYALAFADDLLGPMFRREIGDLEGHLAIVEDFWSYSLLGTDRYQRGTPYSHHAHLKVEAEHFDRWMAAFARAAGETLPSAAADLALKRAEHMTGAFKAGLLPLPKVRPAPAETGL